MIIHTKTKAEYDELMEILEKDGYLWARGEKPTEFNAFAIDKKDTCIDASELYITHDNRNYISDPVTPFKEWKKNLKNANGTPHTEYKPYNKWEEVAKKVRKKIDAAHNSVLKKPITDWAVKKNMERRDGYKPIEYREVRKKANPIGDLYVNFVNGEVSDKPIEEGLRFNEGKTLFDCIPPYAEEMIAKVLTHGAKKYTERNWEKGMKWSTVQNSFARHYNAFRKGEDIDSESGLPHIAHAAVNILFLLEYSKTHPQHDDRRKYS